MHLSRALAHSSLDIRKCPLKTLSLIFNNVRLNVSTFNENKLLRNTSEAMNRTIVEIC